MSQSKYEFSEKKNVFKILIMKSHDLAQLMLITRLLENIMVSLDILDC